MVHMSMHYLYLQFTNLNFLPVFTNTSINVVPVLAFTKPIPDGLLAWHMTLPNNPHLSYQVNLSGLVNAFPGRHYLAMQW